MKYSVKWIDKQPHQARVTLLIQKHTRLCKILQENARNYKIFSEVTQCGGKTVLYCARSWMMLPFSVRAFSCGILTRTLTRPQHTEPVRLSTRSDFLTWEQVDTVGTPWEEDIFVSLLQQLGHQQAQQHYNTEAAFNRKSSIKHRRVNRKQTWNYRIHCTQHMEAVVPVADYATTRLNTISNSSHWWKVVCGNSYPVYE